MDEWIEAFNHLKQPVETPLQVHIRILRQFTLGNDFLRATLSFISKQINNVSGSGNSKSVVYDDRVRTQLKELLNQVDKQLAVLAANGAQTLSAIIPPASTTVSLPGANTAICVTAATAALGVFLQFTTAGVVTGIVGAGIYAAGSYFRQRRLDACWTRDAAVVKMFSDLLFQNALNMLEAFRKCGVRSSVSSALSRPPRLEDDAKLNAAIQQARAGFPPPQPPPPPVPVQPPSSTSWFSLFRSTTAASPTSAQPDKTTTASLTTATEAPTSADSTINPDQKSVAAAATTATTTMPAPGPPSETASLTTGVLGVMTSTSPTAISPPSALPTATTTAPAAVLPTPATPLLSSPGTASTAALALTASGAFVVADTSNTDLVASSPASAPPSAAVVEPYNPAVCLYEPLIVHANLTQAVQNQVAELTQLRGEIHFLHKQARDCKLKQALSPGPAPSVTLDEFNTVWRPLAASASGGSAGYVQKGMLYGRVVANKALLHPDEKYHQRGVDLEARTLAKLRGVDGVSQLVCTVVDDQSPDKLHGLVLKWIEGVTLREYLKQNPALPVLERLHLALEIARTLERLHDPSIPNPAPTATGTSTALLTATSTSTSTPTPTPTPSSNSTVTVLTVSASPSTAQLAAILPPAILTSSAQLAGASAVPAVSSLPMRRPIIHRDFKPNNVMVQSVRDTKTKAIIGRKLVLIDFGFSREMEEKKGVGPNGKDHKDHQAVLTDYPYVGTVAYLAPEIAQHSPWVTPAVDVYAFGISLPEILTGSVWVLSEKEKLSPADIKHFPTGTPKAFFDRLRQLTLQCIDVQHSRRPTMHTVVSRLQDILAMDWTDSLGAPPALSHPPAHAFQADRVDAGVKVNTITEEELQSLPVLGVECNRDGFSIIAPDETYDFPLDTQVVLHHPTADYGVVLSDVTVHQNTLDVRWLPTEMPFNVKYAQNIGKVLKGTRAEIVVQVFVLNGTPSPANATATTARPGTSSRLGAIIGRCRIGVVIQWIGDHCEVLRFFSPMSDDDDHEDEDDLYQSESKERNETMKIKEFGKSRFWVTLPLDWEKITKDTTTSSSASPSAAGP